MNRLLYGAVLLVFMTLVAGGFLTQVQIDTRHERLLDQTSPSAREYQQFLNEFGSDEIVIAAVSGKALFDVEALDTMLVALDNLETIDEVSYVGGIPTVFRDRFGAEDPDALAEELTSTPFYEGLFLSEQHDTAGIVIQTEELDNPAARKNLVAAIREAIEPLEDYGFRVDLVGIPVFDVAINDMSMGETIRMFPIAAVASLIVLVFLLRSWKATVVVLTCGLMTIVLTMGSIVISGRPLNIVTLSLPLILWVLALANCIHVVCRYQHHLIDSDTSEEAIDKTLGELWFACAMSSLTTAVGFLSLLVADILPIKELGFFMALGMVYALAVNLIVAPYLLIRLHAPGPRWLYRGAGGHLFSLGEVLSRHRLPVITVFAILIVSAVYSATRIEAEPDSLKFLPDDAEVVESYDYVAKHLTGLRTIELVVSTPGGWINPGYWPALETVRDELEKSEIVPRVMSPLDFIKKVHQWDEDLDPEFYTLPESEARAEELLELLSDEDWEHLGRFIADEGESIRMSVLVNTMKTSPTEELVARANELVRDLPEPLSGSVTGMAARMRTMDQRLMATQYNSYSLAFVGVFIMLLIGLRSFRITALAMIPNLSPMLAVLTSMALLNIALDAATVMVASISLGIAVDDTVHVLAEYRRLRRLGIENLEAIQTTLSVVGPSITVTTITACIGFFTLAMSAFVPISYFGLLSGIAMIVALLADFFLLPALLTYRKFSY